ncbi:MAG TPA: hypothetical protein PLU24_03965 [Candidatus Omnitrophota bacterium]|nr:hypothetical protein [Candidatus Omnitrophota bacterium]
MILFLLTGILLSTYVMVTSKRIPSLISCFRAQSFFLFLVTLGFAMRERKTELFIVAGLLVLMKVVLVPAFLNKLVKKIKVAQTLGLFMNPVLSLISALLLTYAASVFSSKFIGGSGAPYAAFVVSMTMVLVGFFLMIFRMKAISQIVGMLVMENGIFLLASSLSGGMPFIVEIAVAFDVFVCVIIAGIFMYRINKLFTHIEVSRLTDLRG